MNMYVYSSNCLVAAACLQVILLCYLNVLMLCVQARNIACCVQFKDSDDRDAKALPVCVVNSTLHGVV